MGIMENFRKIYHFKIGDFLRPVIFLAKKLYKQGYVYLCVNSRRIQLMNMHWANQCFIKGQMKRLNGASIVNGHELNILLAA